jgi:hypothetical protein
VTAVAPDRHQRVEAVILETKTMYLPSGEYEPTSAFTP